MERPSTGQWVAIAIVLVMGFLVYWYEYGPGTHRPVEMSDATVASGTAFRVAVPPGFGVVADDDVPVPAGGVALAARSRRGGIRPHIALVPVPSGGGRGFDPTSQVQCELMGRQIASSAGATFESASIIDAPFGRTCEAYLREGKSLRGRFVVAYRGDVMVAITCRFAERDRVTAGACDRVVREIEIAPATGGG